MKLECPNCHKDMIDDYFMIDVKRIKNGLPYKYDARIITCYDCYARLFNASEKEFGEERK